MLLLNLKHFIKNAKIKASKQNHSLETLKAQNVQVPQVQDSVSIWRGTVIPLVYSTSPLVDYYVSVQSQPTCIDDTHGAENAVIHQGCQAGSSVMYPPDVKLRSAQRTFWLLWPLHARRDSSRACSSTSGPPHPPTWGRAQAVTLE